MPLELLYKNDGPWGGGKGDPLTSVEADTNLWAIVQYVQDIEANLAVPVGIDEVVLVTPNSFIVRLTDERVMGPFTIPTARIRWRDQWANGQTYAVNDLIQVEGVGIYWVLQAHTTPAIPAAFDPEAVGEDSQPLYQQMFGPSPVVRYDIPFNILGPLPGGEDMRMGIYVVPGNLNFFLPDELANSVAYLGTACTEPVSIEIYKNDEVIGSIDFDPEAEVDGSGGQFGTLSMGARTDFAPGDKLWLVEPTIVDETAADLSVVFAAFTT